jgi:hypothetical protein
MAVAHIIVKQHLIIFVVKIFSSKQILTKKKSFGSWVFFLNNFWNVIKLLYFKKVFRASKKEPKNPHRILFRNKCGCG